MKYQDFSGDENLLSSEETIVMATSVSANRKRASQHLTIGVYIIINKQNITCPRVDTNFIFECSTRYPTSERSERECDIELNTQR